jgi:Coenzyme PQQ synthesis protein D (PqqD)
MPASPEELNEAPGPDPSGPWRLPRTACPRRRADVIARLLDGETVVLDRPAGVIHHLNHTASYIWARCDGQSTLAAIAHQLAQDFAVEPAVAARDVRVLVQQLQTLHLLESGDRNG